MKVWRKGALFSAVLTLSLFVFVAPVNAETAQRNLGISPLRTEYEIDAGTTKSGTLLIKNSGKTTLNVDMSAEGFAVSNLGYDYVFDPDVAEASWVTFDQLSFSLEPSKSTVVNYSIGVPLSTEPAGYYLALFATTTPSTTSGGINPLERITSLVYITVPGDVTRSGKLIQLNSPVVAFAAPGWSATLQNKGSTHYRSNYSSTITNVIGQPVSSFKDSRLILPNTVRLIEATTPAPQILGLYKVSYFVGLGDNPAYKDERWFLYLPPLQTGLSLAIIIGILYLIRQNRKSR